MDRWKKIAEQLGNRNPIQGSLSFNAFEFDDLYSTEPGPDCRQKFKWMQPGFWFRTRIKLEGGIRIRLKVLSWILIRINLHMTSQNVWTMSLYEHFFKVLSLYLEARIQIRIEMKGRIRIRIKVMRSATLDVTTVILRNLTP